MKQATKALIADLKKHANPKRALVEIGYHKSTRKHFGISSGNMVACIQPLFKIHEPQELIEIAEELWATNIFDFMITATKILKQKKIPKDKKLWKVGVRWLKDCDGWALMDGLSLSMREVLLIHPELLDQVEKWTHHKNFWMRRAALVFTLPYAKPERDPERMLTWASSYADDPEWFIQKAIGWWLRDLGSHNPERVIQCLNKHWGQLKYVAKKEGTRKLDAKWTSQLQSS